MHGQQNIKILKHVCVQNITALVSGQDKQQHCGALTVTSPAALQVTAAVLVRVQVSWDVPVCFWRVASCFWKCRGAFMVLR